eukprot:2743407-Rhodomonas_salina.1
MFLLAWDWLIESVWAAARIFVQIDLPTRILHTNVCTDMGLLASTNVCTGMGLLRLYSHTWLYRNRATARILMQNFVLYAYHHAKTCADLRCTSPGPRPTLFCEIKPEKSCSRYRLATSRSFGDLLAKQ